MYLTESENYRIFYPQKNLNFKFTVFDYNSNNFEIGISGNDYLFFKFKSGIIKDFQGKLVGTFNSEPITINAYLKDSSFDYYLNNKEIAREYSINPTSVFSAISAKILDGGNINLEPYIYGSDIPTLSFLKFYSNESVSGQVINNGSYRIKVFSADSPNTSGEWIFPQYLIPGEVSNFFNYDISGYSDGDIIYLNLETSFGNNLYPLLIQNDGSSPNPDDETTIEESIPLAYSSINLISGQINSFELSTGIYRIDYESTLTNTANLTFDYLTGKFLDLDVSKTLDYPLIYQGTLLGEGDGKGSGTLFPTKEPKSEFYSIDARNKKYVDFYLSGDGPRDFENVYLTGEVTLEAQLSQLKVDLDDRSLASPSTVEFLVDYGGKYLPLQNLNFTNPNYKYSYLTRFLNSTVTGDESITFTGEIPDSSYNGKYTFSNPQSSQKDPFLIAEKRQQILPGNITLKPYRGVAFGYLQPSSSRKELVPVYGFTSTNDANYEAKFVDSWRTPQKFPFWLGHDSPYLYGDPVGSTGSTNQCTIDIDAAATLITDDSFIFGSMVGNESSSNTRLYEAYLTGCNVTGCYVSGTNCFISGDFSIRTYPDPQVQPLQIFEISINSNNIIFYKNLPTIDYNGEFIFDLNSGYLTGILIPTKNTFCQRRNSSFSLSTKDEAKKIIDQMVADSSRAYLTLSPFENIENTVETFSVYSNDNISSSPEKNYVVDWNGNNFICLANEPLDSIYSNIGYFDDFYFLYTSKINYLREESSLSALNLINDNNLWGGPTYPNDGLRNARYILKNITINAFSSSQKFIFNKAIHMLYSFSVDATSKILIPFFSKKDSSQRFIFSFVSNLVDEFKIKINEVEKTNVSNIDDYYGNYNRKYITLDLPSGFSIIEISFISTKSDVELGALMLEVSTSAQAVPSLYERTPDQNKLSRVIGPVGVFYLLFQYFVFKLAGKKGSFGMVDRTVQYIVNDDSGNIINPFLFPDLFFDSKKYFITSNHETNTITAAGSSFKNGQAISVISFSGGGNKISSYKIYYVRNVNGSTFNISETKDGPILDFDLLPYGTIQEKNSKPIEDFFLKYIVGHNGNLQNLPQTNIDKFFLCSRNSTTPSFLSIKKIGSDLYLDGSKVNVDPEDEIVKNIILDKIDNFFTSYEPYQVDLRTNFPKTFYIGTNKIFRRIYGKTIPIDYKNRIIKANIQAGYGRYYDPDNDGFFWSTQNFYTIRNEQVFNDATFRGLEPNFENLNKEVSYTTQGQAQQVTYQKILKTSGNIGMYFPTTSPGQNVYLTRAEMSIPFGEESTWTGVFENFEKKTSDVWDLKLSDDIEGTQNVMGILSPTAEYEETFRLEGIGNSDNDEFLEKTKYLTIKNKWDIASGIADEAKIIFDITNSQKEILFSSEVNIP